MNSRAMAARILHQNRKHTDIPSRHLETLSRDRAFVTEMVLGVIRHQQTLEWFIARLAARKPAENLMAVLSVGLYQLFFLDHIEPFAAVHETVEAAKDLCGPKSSGFVNAVLRRALREKEALFEKLGKQPVSVRYSHPEELVQRWTRRFGAAATEALCAWNNQRPELILRVRGDKPRDILLHELRSAGIAAHGHEHAEFIVLGAFSHVEALPGFEQGRFTVQDPATMLAVDLLAPASGERILDACAAPGGKVIAIADRMRSAGTLVAADLNPLRMTRLQHNLKRCGCNFVQMRVIDATTMHLDGFENQPFDGILLDVPCSNTGVIRRRPEARRRITSSSLRQLIDLQRRILDQALPLLAPGGRLVYSTCSLENEENEGQIEAALARHPQIKLVQTQHHFPPRDHMDGAFAARLERQ
jgi:16S rRNA (cytosine967-C5)-methyltransferase